MIRRKRKASDGDDVPEELCQTTVGKQFHALHDENLDLHDFAADTNLEVRARQRDWFCDGTFDNAPNGYQLYTVACWLLFSCGGQLRFGAPRTLRQ